MNIRYSENLEAYKGFFDHEWMQSLSSVVQGSVLEETVFQLGASWKGTSNARRLPWLMIESLREFSEGLGNYYEPTPLSAISALIENISNRLERRGITLIHTDRQALIDEFRSVENQLSAALQQNRLSMNIEAVWNQFTSEPEFALSLWMSEVNSYASVYFAYETFLITSLKGLLKFQSLRTNRIEQVLRDSYGTDLEQACWSAEPVEIPRLIRHALVHNGRKITRPLERYRDRLLLEDNEIVIMPEDTTQLYDDLKIRVNEFCQTVLS